MWHKKQALLNLNSSFLTFMMSLPDKKADQFPHKKEYK